VNRHLGGCSPLDELSCWNRESDDYVLFTFRNGCQESLEPVDVGRYGVRGGCYQEVI